jgi:homogentisate 1,2-dioxygenase
MVISCLVNKFIKKVPQIGELTIQTEMGFLTVGPKEIAVIQRGIKFSVSISEDSRGW